MRDPAARTHLHMWIGPPDLVRWISVTYCAACMSELSDGTQLCRHHWYPIEPGWAENNRLMCDFIHRKVIPPRCLHADDDSMAPEAAADFLQAVVNALPRVPETS